MTEFTPWASLGGGMLIGLAAVILMASHGRIAGVTAILTGILPPLVKGDWQWKAAFLLGMIASPMVYVGVFGRTIELQSNISTGLLLVSGLIVGIGVTYGSGCTSGHGVCGMARLSRRSIVATVVFMASSILTVFVMRHVIGA